MSVEKSILEALQKGVTAAVEASDDSTLAVKYLGRNFKKPDDKTAWLEVVHIPNNPNGEFWGESRTHQGILRLILHWPMVDKGAYEPMELIESIAAYFEKGTILADPDATVRVRITDHPNLLNVLEEAPEMLLPVSIRYQFFSA